MKPSNKSSKKVIGRGLDALLSDSSGSSSISEISIDQIVPNPDQPRRTFDAEALQELADSISAMGLVQPITVRETEGGTYMIISGERRWRAAKLANRTSLPAYIIKANEEQMRAMALIENIQREDLNAIEIALAYQRLLETEGETQASIAQKVGKTRTSITNYLRLLRLPAEVQLGVTEKKIDMGHARALLALETPQEQLSLYQLILKESLSVRQVEKLAMERKESKLDPSARSSRKKPIGKQALEAYAPLTQQLSKFFQTNVKLTRRASGKGQLSFSFGSEEELIRLCSILEKIAQK